MNILSHFQQENPRIDVQSVFETAKGSQYISFNNIQTKRHKSYHAEHGMHDQGWKQESIMTVYISKEDALYVSGALRGNGWLVMLCVGETFELHFVLRDWKTKGIIKTMEVLPYQSEPRIGLCPIEFFDTTENENTIIPGNIHPGNQITKVLLQ